MDHQRSIKALSDIVPFRRVFITGGASGLGLTLANCFAAQGWHIGLYDFQSDALTSAKRQLSLGKGRVCCYEGDVREPASLTAAVNDFAKHGLGIMINNAGVAAGGGFLERSNEDWHWTFDINLMGTVNGCRAALPHLQTHGGLLHNVASAAGFMASPLMSSYNASKAAVLSLSESLIAEYSDVPKIGISVSMPAFFKTELLQRLRASEQEHNVARLLMEHSGYTVEDAAKDILAGLARQQTYILAPRRLSTLWRWKRWFPQHYLQQFPRLRRKRIAALTSKY
ncbi:SDR family NAD(P)-dependent oxidoreductase [Aestuariibacter halophilus]|uniref:SDR family NAD(P)-dependent oxidoreductase n=1 Tax=Fluctibacter halophilus TaxID=226011 RepID=A0ABS8G387_9ALTE|nr:SDR family NAD(P)-dependent oxidoreductase [Aestuariibacter halophilus]MCC2615035.1 SDR family NAD(P)-dependent oxidoreductase [Aestuariibacter halophilus]